MKTPSHSKQSLAWGIRAGKNGEAHDLFIKCSLIVLSDADLGDLRLLPKERSAFYDAYGSRHSEEGRVAIRGIGGKFFRFVHEVQIGDLMLYPCIRDKQIYVGEVTGAYYYDHSHDLNFPHRRTIKWLVALPKKSISEFARRELGAARTFFCFKTHMKEIQQLLVRKLNRAGAK